MALSLGAGRANLNGKSNVGKSYVVFGKTNGNAIDLSTIADANNPTGGFVIQIIQAIAVDIACTGD
jgi:Neuraminidase (sialidase)